MSPFRYLGAWAVAALTAWGIYAADWRSIVVPVVIFVLVPLAEQFLPQSTRNLTPDEEKAVLADRRYEWVLVGLVPVQWVLILGLWFVVGTGRATGIGLVGATAAAGIGCAGIAINLGHELMHRRNRFDRTMSQILLTSTLYTHFFIEHTRGHHVRVSTPEDPASARRDELIYTFWLRSIAGGWRHAWQLEFDRMRLKGHARFSPRNQMVQFLVVQAAAVALCLAVAGPLALAAWGAASAMGILILETINYVEHYGLQRERRADGRYERVRPVHSWNCNHAIGRILLFELTRHSDHHENPLRQYPVLRHFDDAPQLPIGYPGMVVLALFPPLYRRVMDPLLDAWEADQAPAVPLAA